MARKPLILVVVMFGMLVLPGCEVVLSAFVQKDWNTDPVHFKDKDLTSKIELKVTKLIGADAKKKGVAK